MENWAKISLLLSVFGFFKEIHPSEPYATEYFTGPERNITHEVLNREIYPVSIYSYLALLVVFFLITDFVRYKPIILLNGFVGIIVWALVLWTKSIAALQVDQFFFGTYLAAEVAYFTYIYAKVDKEHYPKVTSHTRAGLLCGKLVGGILAQVIVSFQLMQLRDLNYITFGAQIIATLWAFLLPNVDNSLYFHRNAKTESREEIVSTEEKSQFALALKLLWSHFKNAYTNPKVIQWSVLYAVGVFGYFQILSFIQIVWNILGDGSVLWNGAVEVGFTFFGALVALLAGYVHAGRINSRASLLIIAGLLVLQGLSIFIISKTESLYVSYVCYIVFGVLYSYTITVIGAEVARHLEEESFALIFGINTFVAILLQVIFTFAVVSPEGFALDINGQFTVYAVYYFIVAGFFAAWVLIEYLLDRHHGTKEKNNV